MGGTPNMDKIAFDKEALYKKHKPPVKSYREELFRKFTRNMTALLEAREPKRYQSNRGLLDPRKLYRHQMDDSVFYKKTSVPKSDTTFLFLIDTSGSMSGYTSTEYEDYNLDRIEIANAIVSAFAKANKVVLNNKIKMEVFTKSEAGEVFNSFVKGYVPILSRVFSNVKNDTDWDKILDLETSAPITINERASGSYTPEFLLLPALLEWCRKNITTKNMVIINLTDGEVVHNFIPKESLESYIKDGYGVTTYRAINDDTKALRIKYLRGIPNLTMYLDGGRSDHHAEQIKDTYGTNAVTVSDDNFDVEFFKTINQLINEYA